MKPLIALTALFLLTAQTAAAQDHPATAASLKEIYAQRVAGRMDIMFEGIKVTPAILDKTVDIMMAGQNGPTPDPNTKEGAALIAARVKKRNDAIKALLVNPADKARFDANDAAYQKTRKK